MSCKWIGVLSVCIDGVRISGALYFELMNRCADGGISPRP